jgi:hypothetical protein
MMDRKAKWMRPTGRIFCIKQRRTEKFWQR